MVLLQSCYLLCFCQLCSDLFAVGLQLLCMNEESSRFLQLSLLGLHHSCKSRIAQHFILMFTSVSELPYILHQLHNTKQRGRHKLLIKDCNYSTSVGHWRWSLPCNTFACVHPSLLCMAYKRKPYAPICLALNTAWSSYVIHSNGYT